MFFNSTSDGNGGSTLAVKGKGVPSIIAGDMSILGNIISEGAIEIAGRVEGNIKCDGLHIHPGGLVKGDIIAKSVKINGEVNGVVKSKYVMVQDKGKVHGHILYESITISEGATIFGQMKQIDKNEIHQAEDNSGMNSQPNIHVITSNKEKATT